MKFARFRVDGYDYYGQVDGDRLRAIQGDLSRTAGSPEPSTPWTGSRSFLPHAQ